MSRKVSITYEGLSKILEGFDKLSAGGTSKLIRASARLCAVQLALRTQPFSIGKEGAEDARTAGAKRVEYDIGRVLRSNEGLLDIAEHIKDQQIQERFRQLVNAGDYEGVAKILRATRIYIGFGSVVEHLKTQGSIASAHKANRNKRSGRTYGKADKMYIVLQKDIEKYSAMVSKRVGRSKSGWADCARKINAVKGDGARGVPSWAKSKTHGNHGQVNDNAGAAPTGFVEMTNTIPWTDRICPNVEREYALTFAKTNFIKSLQYAFKAAAKKHPDILDFVNQQVEATNTGQ